MQVQYYALEDTKVPADMQRKPYQFPGQDGCVPVIAQILTRSDSASPPDLQFMLCDALNVDSASLFQLMADLALGRFPQSLVICEHPFGVGASDGVSNRILWFAINAANSAVVFDVTDWYALPCVKFCDFPCVKNTVQSHQERVRIALQELSDSIDLIAPVLTTAQLLDVMDKLKAAHGVMLKE